MENYSKPAEIAEVSKSNSNKTNNTNNTENNKTDIFLEDEEEKPPQSRKEEKKDLLSRKVDKATQYDRDYIQDLVHDQLLKENFSQASAEYTMTVLADAIKKLNFTKKKED